MIDVGSAYFCCDECPISEDVERRYRNADEAGAFQYDHCGCDKIDYPFFVGRPFVRKIILNELESVRLARRIEERCA